MTVAEMPRDMVFFLLGCALIASDAPAGYRWAAALASFVAAGAIWFKAA